MGKVYPEDIYGIKKIGIEKWFDNYYVPVSGREYYSIYSNVFNSYMSLSKKLDNDIVFWVCLSYMNYIPTFITKYIHKTRHITRLKEKGYEYLIGHDKRGIFGDISVYDLSSHACLNLIEKHMAKLNSWGRFKNILRTIKYNTKPSAVLNRNYLKNMSKPCFLIGNRDQQQVVEFCNENNISPIHIHPMLSATSTSMGIDLVQYTKKLDSFIQDFLLSVSNIYEFLNSAILEELKREIVECFKYSLLFFFQNFNKFKKHKPKKILATGLSSPVNRLFCAACKLSGGELISFVHGNSYCNSYTQGPIRYLSFVDKYYASSPGHEEILKQVANDFSLGLKMSDIVHFKRNFYRPLFERLQRTQPVSGIKKVMIVGAVMSMRHYRTIDGEYHTFARLYHQIEIIKLLKSKGYYVIYKQRPETEDEVKGVFDGYADEIMYGRSFEDTYHYADCLLFCSPYTSTFGFSLLTNKPIVLINSKGNTWYPRAYELVKKRCAVVEAESNDAGKIVFKGQDVLDAIEASLKNINYDVVYEFAF